MLSDSASAEKELVCARNSGGDEALVLVPLAQAYLMQRKFSELLADIRICVVIAVGTFFVAHRLSSRQRWLAWADAIGLATFSIVGTQVAIGAGAPSVVAVLMGIMTATFGGIMRDVLCAEISLILQREIYAMAAAAGAIVYVLGLAATGNEPLSAVLAFCVAFAARAAGILLQLSLPRFTRRR